MLPGIRRWNCGALVTGKKFAELIRALTEAGINAYGQDPIVPYEMLITREDALFCHALKIRLDDPDDCA